MTRTVAVLLGAGFVVIVIGIVALIQIINGNGDNSPLIRSVEIIAPKGTQVVARLPDDSEKHLGDLVGASLTVDVADDATIILRFREQEKIFPPQSWRDVKIIEPFVLPTPVLPPPSRVVTVSINAVPWAKVYIKLPGTHRFVKPSEKISNVTPIRGGLRVPVGTAIKLVYKDKEKTFGYEAWKKSNTISHDFLSP